MLDIANLSDKQLEQLYDQVDTGEQQDFSEYEKKRSETETYFDTEVADAEYYGLPFEERERQKEAYIEKYAGPDPRPKPEPEKKEHGLGDILAEGAKTIPSQIAGNIAAAIQGDEVGATDDSFLDRVIQRTNQKLDKYRREYGQDTEDVALGLSDQDIVTGISNLGYSFASMGAGLTAGAPTSLLPVPGARGAAWAAGTAASGVTSFNISQNSFLRLVRDTVNEERVAAGDPKMNEQEWGKVKGGLEGKTDTHALWEALPEALGNAVGFGIITAPIRKKIFGKISGRLATLAGMGTKSAGVLAEETAQEVITEKGQAPIQKEVGLREDIPTVGEAIEEVWGPVAVTTGIMGPMAKGAHVGYSKIKGRSKAREALEEEEGVTAEEILTGEKKQEAPQEAQEKPEPEAKSVKDFSDEDLKKRVTNLKKAGKRISKKGKENLKAYQQELVDRGLEKPAPEQKQAKEAPEKPTSTMPEGEIVDSRATEEVGAETFTGAASEQQIKKGGPDAKESAQEAKPTGQEEGIEGREEGQVRIRDTEQAQEEKEIEPQETPVFSDYDSAMEYVDKKAKEYGGKNKYLASDEYKELHPYLQELRNQAVSPIKDKADKAMQEAGVKHGDTVEYTTANPFGQQFTFRGVVKKNKDGLPYVSLDKPGPNGKKRGPWHKGYKPVEPKAEKEPWKMTRDKWVDGHIKSPAMHKEHVKRALSENKPVPSEVLKDYPELQAQAKPAQPEAKAKEPWEMTKEEFAESGIEREKEVPVVSFEDFAEDKGVELPAGRDYADLIGGLGTEKTKAGKGKLKAPAKKIDDAQRLAKEYKEAIDSGEIKTKKQVAPLDKNIEADDAYIKAMHKRAIRKALSEGKPVPKEVLKEYPELQREQAGPSKKAQQKEKPEKRSKKEGLDATGLNVKKLTEENIVSAIKETPEGLMFHPPSIDELVFYQDKDGGYRGIAIKWKGDKIGFAEKNGTGNELLSDITNYKQNRAFRDVKKSTHKIAEATETKKTDIPAIGDRIIFKTEGGGRELEGDVKDIYDDGGLSVEPITGINEIPIKPEQFVKITKKSRRRVNAEKLKEQEIEIEGKKDKTVTADIPKKEAESLTPKEQKAYLIAEIDKAIKEAPDVPIAEHDKAVEDRFEKLAENKKQYGTVTIEIPGDGEFEIFNTKQTLNEFKKQAKSFPTSPKHAWAKPKTPKKQTAAPTNKRIIGKGIEYYNPFKPRSSKPIIEEKGKAVYYENGLFSDAAYFIKTPKPETKESFSESPAFKNKAKEMLSAKGLKPAEIVGESASDFLEGEPVVHAVSGENHGLYKAKYIDAISSKYPNASVFADKDGFLKFKDEGKVVAGVMSFNLGGTTLKDMPSVVQEGYKRIKQSEKDLSGEGLTSQEAYDKNISYEDTTLKEPSEVFEKPVKFEQLELEGETAAPAKTLPDRQRVRVATTGNISYSGNVVRDRNDVAALLASIRKSAQEHFYTVATDKDGNVLEIHKYAKGQKSRVEIEPVDVAGRVFNQKEDVAKVYVVHNHPSGNPAPSAEDIEIANHLSELFRLKAIKSETIAIGDTKWGDSEGNVHKIRPTLRTKSLPVKERFISKIEEIRKAEPIDSPQAAQKWHAQNTNGGEGFLFLNTKTKPVSFADFPKGKKMKDAAAQLIAKFEETNASSAIAFFDKPPNETRIDFMRDFQSMGGPKFLDLIIGSKESYKNEGKLPDIVEGGNYRNFIDNTTELYSTTPSSAGLTLKDVQSIFKGQKVGLSPNKDVWVKTKAGHGLKIKTVDQISPDETAFNIEYGRMRKDGELIAGSYKDGVIKISRAGDKFSLSHESVHFAEDTGLLTPKELQILKNAYVKKHGIDKLSDREKRAKFIESELENREKYRGTPAGRVLQKIADFMDSLANLFKQTARGVARDIESGRIYNREGRAQNTTVPAYEKTAQRWYSQMEQHLEAKLPNQATPKALKDMLNSWAEKGLIKSEELEWSGVLEWLDEQTGKVKKQDALDSLKENNVRVEEGWTGAGTISEEDRQEIITLEDDLYDATADLNTKSQELLELLERAGASPTEQNIIIGGIRNNRAEGFRRAEEFIDKLEYDINTVPDAIAARDRAEEELREAKTFARGIEAKFSDPVLNLPGGKNYKELLLTLPESEAGKPKPVTELPEGYKVGVDYSQPESEKYHVLPPGQVHARPYAGRHPSPEVAKTAAIGRFNQKRYLEWKESKQHFLSGHWEGEPNVLAHVRFNERTGPNGEKILFIEEVQSDWHQEGRKKGYQAQTEDYDKLIDEFNRRMEEKYNLLELPPHQRVSARNERMTPEEHQELTRLGLLRTHSNQLKGVPDAPFKKTWPLLAMKRMVRYAAENGFDTIGWTTGEQQVTRYKDALRKAVDKIEWTKTKDGIHLKGFKGKAQVIGTTEKENALSDAIGKTMGDQIINDPNQTGVIEGDDITISDTGMAGFYDKILPSAANKFFGKKKWGKAKAGEMFIPADIAENIIKEDAQRFYEKLSEGDTENDIIITDGDIASAKQLMDDMSSGQPASVALYKFLNRSPNLKEEAQDVFGLADKALDKRVATEAHSLPITDQMKSKALREGMPLFQSKIPTKLDQYSTKMAEDVLSVNDTWKKGKPDTNLLEAITSIPLHYWTKKDENGKPEIEALHRMFTHTIDSKDNFYEEVYNITMSGEDESMLARLEEFRKANRKEYDLFSQYLQNRDMNSIGYRIKKEGDEWVVKDPNGKAVTKHTSEDEAKQDTIRRELADFKAGKVWKGEAEAAKDLGFGKIFKRKWSDQAVKSLEAVRAMTDRAFDLYAQPMHEMLQKANADAVEAGYTVEEKDGKYQVLKEGMPQGGLFGSRDEAWGSVLVLPELTYEDEQGNKTQIDFNVALAELGDRRGYYMPRIRQPGRFVLEARKEGANSVRRHYDLAIKNPKKKTWKKIINAPTPIRKEARRLKQQGYNITIRSSEQVSEDVFEMLSPAMAAYDIINAALEKTGSIKGTSTLQDLGLRGEWKDNDYLLYGALHNPKHKEAMESLGGEYKYIRRDKQGNPRWKFKDAEGNIEKKIERRIFEMENINPDLETKFTDMLGHAVGDIIKGRGARGHMIQRSPNVGKKVWIGYETDPAQALGAYAQKVAAGEAKKNLAINLIRDITGTWESWGQYKETHGEDADWQEWKALVKERSVESSKQPNAYRDAKAFMEDVLRNDEAADRALGVLKGGAVFKFLAFRVFSAPLVNLTALPTSAVGAMNGIGKIPIAQSFTNIAKAGRLYMLYRRGDTDRLSPGMKKVFDEIRRKGLDEPQYDRETLSYLRAKSGRAFEKAIDIGMFTFKLSESFNRGATIAGAYIGLKKQGYSHEAAMEKAREISDKAHGVYHKANYPHLARGKNIGAMTLKSFYVFRTFSHNYLLTMKELGFDQKDYSAFAWMVLSPAVLAGAGASVATPIVAALGRAFGYDDPEEEVYAKMQENFGDFGETISRHGLFGLAGINLKGSLSIDVGVKAVPSNFKELFGAPAGVLADIYDGAGNLINGNTLKAVEDFTPLGFGNIAKAYRERTQGITTRANTPVFYGLEPLKATPGDAALRALGFNPARLSGIREKQWKERVLKYKYRERVSNIYSRIKKFYLLPREERTKERYAEILEDIYEYNRRVLKRRPPNAFLITGKSIRAMLLRAFRPNKKERARAYNEYS